MDNTPIKLVVIGAGPGGYAAAFLAADMGMQVTLIDKEENPGGVCVYRGCIPSKALLHAAKVLNEAHEIENIGITFSKPNIDLNKLRAWKNSVVTRLTSGTGQLRKQRKITNIQGTAKFLNSTSLEVTTVDGKTQTVTFDKAIVATGSRPATIPTLPKSKNILDSTAALDLENVPEKLLTIGGGYIGLELSTVYDALGSKVTVVEMMPQLLTGADRDLANILIKRIESKFSKVMTSTKVLKVEEISSGLKVTFEDGEGKQFTDEFGKILVSIGRRPNTENIGLENTKAKVTERGFVKVNAQLKTDDDNIYAIGDIAGNPMLAHKASHEGRTAVEAIAGHKVAFEPQAIPAVVFTDPEVAWCGLTELEAKDKGLEVQVVKFPWGASGRAITLERVDGLTKLIIDTKTERILGMGIVGVGAGELISEGVLAVEMGAVVSDIKLSIHPHPTISETVMESAENFFGTATHFYRPRKS
ncbi:MAG: dihydrolipoyl dehydrogenase [Candidatus Omnitrophica bacterium]|nr:dihydrolipoyl dehydrogenase [Candidatus Omnitrophota bacterium]